MKNIKKIVSIFLLSFISIIGVLSIFSNSVYAKSSSFTRDTGFTTSPITITGNNYNVIFEVNWTTDDVPRYSHRGEIELIDSTNNVIGHIYAHIQEKSGVNVDVDGGSVSNISIEDVSKYAKFPTSNPDVAYGRLRATWNIIVASPGNYTLKFHNFEMFEKKDESGDKVGDSVLTNTTFISGSVPISPIDFILTPGPDITIIEGTPSASGYVRSALISGTPSGVAFLRGWLTSTASSVHILDDEILDYSFLSINNVGDINPTLSSGKIINLTLNGLSTLDVGTYIVHISQSITLDGSPLSRDTFFRLIVVDDPYALITTKTCSTHVTLTWNGISGADKANDYDITRWTGSDPSLTFKATGATYNSGTNKWTYIDTDVAAIDAATVEKGSLWTYTVQAKHTDVSRESFVNTRPDYCKPNSLSVSRDCSSTKKNALAWTAPSDPLGLLGFNIYRSDNNGVTYNIININPPGWITVLTYNDATSDSTTVNHNYVVKSVYSTTGEVGVSNTAASTACPATPVTFTASCSANPTSLESGGSVVYTVAPNPSTGTYTYSWPTGASVRVTYPDENRVHTGPAYTVRNSSGTEVPGTCPSVTVGMGDKPTLWFQGFDTSQTSKDKWDSQIKTIRLGKSIRVEYDMEGLSCFGHFLNKPEDFNSSTWEGARISNSNSFLINDLIQQGIYDADLKCRLVNLDGSTEDVYSNKVKIRVIKASQGEF